MAYIGGGVGWGNSDELHNSHDRPLIGLGDARWEDERLEKHTDRCGPLGNISSGTWYLSSKSDPRWNSSGHINAISSFVMPNECQNEINQLKKQYGEPPSDLEWGYMKD